MLKAAAVAGLAPRRAARSHHSWKPTRWARLGAKMAMSWGTSPSVSGTSMSAALGREVLGHAEAVVLGLADACRAVDEDQRGHPLGMGGGQPDGRHGAPGGCEHDGTPAAGGVHHGQCVAAPALNGEADARGQRVGEAQAPRVEADQAAEVADALGVAEPVRLVGRFVDGDHQPAAELEDVHRVGRTSAPHLEANVDAVVQGVLGPRSCIRIAVCRAGRARRQRERSARRQVSVRLAERRQVSVRLARGARAPRRSPRPART